jgi:hypothetical protein
MVCGSIYQFSTQCRSECKTHHQQFAGPYLNSDDAGTPENFKSFVVSGAKGSGGTNYTGTFTTTQTSTCAVPPVATRGINSLTTTDVVTRKKPDISTLLHEQLSDGKLNVQVFPNPSSNYFNLVIKGNPVSPVTVRVLDISGRGNREI